MANPWFRLYVEFGNDPKVQSMSEAMQRRLIMLMCLRCDDTLETLSDEDIAFKLRISDEELELTRAIFVKKGFTSATWEIKNWTKRQFVSDAAAKRQKAYRDRIKNGQKTGGSA